MDPMRTEKPIHWRSYGRLAVALLVVAVLMVASGWVASASGRDPSVVYRIAALATAGAAMTGLIWAGSAKSADRTAKR